MAVQLGWRPTSVPTVERSRPARAGDRRDFGLEITGNNDSVADGAEGVVKLIEVSGSGANAGSSEAGSTRLIATFHGTWHRAGSGRRTALTFEIFLPAGHSTTTWRMHGYDPECIPGFGVDGFALTFVGKVFPVNFPFFLDTATEGRFVELQAVAEWDASGTSTEFARSPVLNVPIRRNHAIASTTASPSGSGNMSYTDDLIGNVILHHESYLIQTSRIRSGATWPSSVVSEFVAIRPSQRGAFANYASLASDHKLRIYIQGVVADELLPAATDAIWTSAPLNGFGGTSLRASLLLRVRQRIVDTLTEIFVNDAGFTGGAVVFLDTAPSSDATATVLNGRGPFTTPFFTFLVQLNNRLSEVAHAEEVDYLTTPSTLAGFDWLLPSAFPLGSNDKTFPRGIQFKSAFFSEHFSRFLTRPRRRGEPALTQTDVEGAADKQATKLSETIAHEVGHSLGLMHESEVGSWDEERVGPLRSIMCSLTDSQPFGAGVRFSNQAKIIWRDAFGLAPNLPTGTLVNKTWSGTEWRTVEWSDRIQRIMQIVGETSIVSYPLDHGNQSPYATMPSPQPGTYVPASP